MNLMLISVFITLAALLLLLGFKFKKSSDKVHAMQLSGIALIVQLKVLISYLQKHRGLSAALCKDEPEVGADLTALKYDVKQTVIELDRLLDDNDRWIGFKDHWQRLSMHYRKTSADNSFKQHTHMISNVIFLVEDIAQYHALNQDHFPSIKHIEYTWSELISLIESIGQSRAIGTSSVISKQCSENERNKLKFLRQQITQTSEKILKNINDGDEDLNNLTQHSLKKTRYLASAIVNDIIDQEEIKLTRKEYFDLATDTIVAVNKVFDYQINQIKTAIQTSTP